MNRPVWFHSYCTRCVGLVCVLPTNAHITVWNNTGAYLVWFVSSVSKTRQNLLAKQPVCLSLVLLVVLNHGISMPQEQFACSWILLSGTQSGVPCCALFQWDHDQGFWWAMGGLRGYVMRKLSRVICPHAVVLAHVSKADLQTEEIESAPKDLAIYASSFFICCNESKRVWKAPFLVLFR